MKRLGQHYIKHLECDILLTLRCYHLTEMANSKIRNALGEIVDAQSPIIISASRSTDIPAFYSDWFLSRLKAGYSVWVNPFNGVRSYVAYDNVRLIVFWSKNPEHLLDEGGLLDYLELKGINCYVQYTLNNYVLEKLEPGVPSVYKRIDTFKRLVDKLGFGLVIWRFDPLILTDKISVDDLLEKTRIIGDQLKGYTEKMIFSYADISSYQRVKVHLDKCGIRYQEFDSHNMIRFAEGLQHLNNNWNYTLATCAEKIDLDKFGVVHNKCIDDDLMIRHFSDDAILMDFLGITIENDLFEGRSVTPKKTRKDKGQRLYCGCVTSKDIGEYNTCIHMCEYCYANSGRDSALANFKKNRQVIDSETITGK